jgi:hypothetical protein
MINICLTNNVNFTLSIGEFGFLKSNGLVPSYNNNSIVNLSTSHHKTC